MGATKKWRCWKCATTLKTRRQDRINRHKNVCGTRPSRVLSQMDLEDGMELKKRSRRGGSLDLFDGIGSTPCVSDWEYCPINNCGAYIKHESHRKIHLNRHRYMFQQKQGNKRKIGLTPADYMTECMQSAAGPSNEDHSNEIDFDGAVSSSSYEMPEDSMGASVYYRLNRPVSQVENVRLKSTEERLSFKLTEEGLEMARNGHLLALIDIIIRDIIEKHRKYEHAQLRIIFDSDSMDYAFSGSFHRADDFDVYSFLEQLERILNSKQSISTDENIEIYIQSVADPMSGSGRHTFKRRDYANTQQFFQQRKSVFYINNTDNNCFFLAIAAGLRFMGLTGKKIPKTQKLKRNYARWLRTPHKDKTLKKISNQIREAANHQDNTPVTPQLFPVIQNILCKAYKIQLIVFNSEDHNAVYFAGQPSRDAKHQLHLTYGSNHYCYIKRLKTYLNGHVLCHLCYRPYLKLHKCALRCDRCETRACFQQRRTAGTLANLSALTVCDKCGFLFYSDMCLAHHQKRDVCQNYVKCNKCDRIHQKDNDHDCEHFECPNCKEKVAYPHLCSTQIPVLKNKAQFVFIFFDIETYVDSNAVHKPYLICFDRVCEKCWDTELKHGETCEKCGHRTRTFYGLDCASKFCEYLIQKDNEGAVLLSHNGSGFDNYFIIDQIISEKGDLEVTTRGHRFLSVKIGRNIKMLDTYLFFFCKLSALSSIFEIPEEKGYFPFKLAARDNLNAVFEKHPARDFYAYDQMSSKDRKRFMEWYVGVANKQFDFRQEAINYCKIDVTLLRKASMLFRKFVTETYGVDPWQNALTLSHLASLIYRKCFLPTPSRLGIMPSNGYTDMYRKQTSLLCVKYLEWIMCQTNQTIIHGGTELEPRYLGKYPCDGVELINSDKPVSLKNTNRIWDIRGCFYHVHRDNCKINRRVPTGEVSYGPDDLNKKHPLKKSMTYRDILDADNLRVRWFESRGIDVSIVYQCEIEQMVKENREMATFFNNVNVWKQYVLPIGPRDALFGGRVTVGRLLCELSLEEQRQGYQIMYDDFISLYPSVMRSNAFPIGHPEIIKFPNLPNVLNLHNIDDYFGVIKASVLPPKTLLHGVLPYRANGKLLFPLCVRCADEYTSRTLQNDDFDKIGNVLCPHSKKERTFWGVFCSVELKLALEMGYKVRDVSEIWKYERGDLFSGYVNGMIAMKLENSGYPEHCITDAQKQAYIDNMANDNIVLDPLKMRKCNGKRQIGKLFANSLWGKICQGIEVTNTEFIKEPKDLSRLLRDPTIDISDVVFLNRGECLCISSKRRKEVQRSMQMYSPSVGAFVTAYGRIRLFELMHAAGRNFIYGDTDSVIYKTGPDMFKTTHGTTVGEISSEVDWPKDYITNFVAIGPKTYCYQTKNGLSSIKAKGLSLKCEIGETLDFDHLKTIVLGHSTDIGPMFYNQLDEPLRTRLLDLHEAKFSCNPKPFLLLPQKRIKKNKTSIELENSEMIKILQSSGDDKRRILRNASLRTVEFGYRTPKHLTSVD